MGIAPLPYLAWVSADLVQAWRALGAELQRRADARAFTPSDGLKVKGSAADQRTYLDMLRRAMERSPSFHKLMLAIDADRAHPVEITVGRNQPGIFVDTYDSKLTAGKQELDLADLKELPVDPPRDEPNAVTQGELLAHAMAEAREGAAGADYPEAHMAGITAQNDYRDDRGQAGHRRPPPDDGRHNSAGNWEMTYDNRHNEVWVKKDDGIQKIHRMQL